MSELNWWQKAVLERAIADPDFVLLPPPIHQSPRHPITGRFMAFDCEIDCLEHCAGLCGT